MEIFGHNRPCILQELVTTLHSFAVDLETLHNDWDIVFTNKNDKTNEGIVHKEKQFYRLYTVDDLYIFFNGLEYFYMKMNNQIDIWFNKLEFT